MIHNIKLKLIYLVEKCLHNSPHPSISVFHAAAINAMLGCAYKWEAITNPEGRYVFVYLK